MGGPTLERGQHGIDDLAVEIEAQVVARGEVGEPLVADADHAAVDLVDDGVHHRMGRLEGREALAGLEPVVQPGTPPGLGLEAGLKRYVHPHEVGYRHARAKSGVPMHRGPNGAPERPRGRQSGRATCHSVSRDTAATARPGCWGPRRYIRRT